MTKFVRILIIINGIIIPCFVLFGLFQMLERRFNKSEDKPTGIIVGDELNQAKKQNLSLQGVEYSSPQEIHNSKGKYLTVSIMTYEEAKVMEMAISSSNNFGYSLMNISNILFLDSTLNKTHWLIDRKASIRDLDIKGNYGSKKDIDTNYKYLAYEIGFEDSNHDGLINSEDYHDLYISDLNGKNLSKVTENIDLIQYEFQNKQSSIFIRYVERNDSIRLEHKLKKFAVYDIERGEFKTYDQLNKTLEQYQESLSY